MRLSPQKINRPLPGCTPHFSLVARLVCSFHRRADQFRSRVFPIAKLFPSQAFGECRSKVVVTSRIPKIVCHPAAAIEVCLDGGLSTL